MIQYRLFYAIMQWQRERSRANEGMAIEEGLRKEMMFIGA
jgi:hypothetical protein